MKRRRNVDCSSLGNWYTLPISRLDMCSVSRMCGWKITEVKGHRIGRPTVKYPLRFSVKTKKALGSSVLRARRGIELGGWYWAERLWVGVLWGGFQGFCIIKRGVRVFNGFHPFPFPLFDGYGVSLSLFLFLTISISLFNGDCFLFFLFAPASYAYWSLTWCWLIGSAEVSLTAVPACRCLGGSFPFL